MPIATPDMYARMLDRAKEHGFAYPSINVTSSQTLNAALRGFADAHSDGIVQISTGGAEYLSGQRVKDMVTGAVALAEFAHVVAAGARSTSRCTPTTARKASWTPICARSSRCPRSGVLKIDGDVGRKKDYDPRSWGRAAEASMTDRVKLACEELMSAGKQMS